MKLPLLAVFTLFSGVAFAQENFDSVKISTEKITDHLYFLKGAGGNIGVLTGTDGTLMVDDQFAPLSNKINGAIKTISPEEIRFLINTHLHGDHSGGNENFAMMGTTVVAHESVRARMSHLVRDTTKGTTAPARIKEAWPVVTFNNTMAVHLNEEDIHLIHLDPAHTDGDVAVHFVKANVFHLGDVFVTYGYPYIDYSNGGSINGFISTLDKLLAMMDDNTRIIPGHGDLCRKGDVKQFRDRLADIRDQVAAALKKGKKVEDITGMAIASKYDAEWGKGFIKGKDFVLSMADNLNSTVIKK